MTKCKHCGKDFKQRFGTEKYCSRECFNKDKRVELVEVKCPVCNETFKRRETLLKEEGKMFCSQKCYIKSRTKHKYEERICEYCGETYTIYSKYKNKYCSVDCSNKHRFEKRREKEFDELLQNM